MMTKVDFKLLILVHFWPCQKLPLEGRWEIVKSSWFRHSLNNNITNEHASSALNSEAVKTRLNGNVTNSENNVMTISNTLNKSLFFTDFCLSFGDSKPTQPRIFWEGGWSYWRVTPIGRPLWTLTKSSQTTEGWLTTFDKNGHKIKFKCRNNTAVRQKVKTIAF